MIQKLKTILVLSVCTTTVSILFSCNSLSGKPGKEEMQNCLISEMEDKIIVFAFEQLDGLSREKDGVKYYEGYFNAEIKFVSNARGFKAGDEYKIVKGTVSFMKTEKGWNCQKLDYSSSNMIKIKERGGEADHVNAAPSRSGEYRSSDRSSPAAESSESRHVSTAPGLFPEGSTRLLTHSDVANLSADDLAIMRNEIFARHGYIFQTDAMRNYFGSQSWYSPMYEDVSGMLSGIEKSNISFIKRYE